MRANDLDTLSLPGEQDKVTTPAQPDRARLPAYLRGLPSLAFSDKGRATICQRFGLTDDELTTALAAHGPADEHPTRRPTPAKEFGADALACALVLTGTNRPTLAQLDAALLEMYPVGGPTAASLVAAGWLLPTVDKKALRLPPLPTAVSPQTPHRDGNR